jgi:hypothetical protein
MVKKGNWSQRRNRRTCRITKKQKGPIHSKLPRTSATNLSHALELAVLEMVNLLRGRVSTTLCRGYRLVPPVPVGNSNPLRATLNERRWMFANELNSQGWYLYGRIGAGAFFPINHHARLRGRSGLLAGLCSPSPNRAQYGKAELASRPGFLGYWREFNLETQTLGDDS